MEYEFRHDAITRAASVTFSEEHSVLGPWLETEIGTNRKKVALLIARVNDVIVRKSHEEKIVGREFSIVVSYDDVVVFANATENGLSTLPENLSDEQLALDEHSRASCGPEDFLEMLKSWQAFIA